MHDGVWKTYGVGEKIIIEKGVPHTLRNSSNQVTRVLNTHQPALKMGEYFEKLNRIFNSSVVKNEKIGLKALMHLMLLMTSYEDEIVPVNPPAPVAGVFGFMGKRPVSCSIALPRHTSISLVAHYPGTASS